MKSLKISSSLIFLLALALVLLVYFTLVYRPLSDSVEALDMEHKANQTIIEKYNDYLPRMQEVSNSILEEQTKMELAEKNSNINLIADVYAGFQNCGIIPGDLTTGSEMVLGSGLKSTSGKLLCSISITLNFTTTSERLVLLTNYFEKESEGAYYINTMSYTAAEENKMNVNMLMTLYYFSQTAVAPADASASKTS